MNFKFITTGENLFVTSGKKYEYYRYPKKLRFLDCNLACPLLDAQMPKTSTQLQEARKLFNLTTEIMWVTTEQTATVRKRWSWKHKYHYNAFLARACRVPVGQCSGGRLATTLVATKNEFFFFFPVVYFSHRRSAWIKKLI